MVRCGLADDELVPVQRLFEVAYFAELAPLQGQLVLWSSKTIADSFGRQVLAARGKTERFDAHPVVYKSSEAGIFSDAPESRLAQYNFACVEESMKSNVMCISVDKANPGKQTVSNGVIVFPNNVMVLCCPTVKG